MNIETKDGVDNCFVGNVVLEVGNIADSKYQIQLSLLRSLLLQII